MLSSLTNLSFRQVATYSTKWASRSKLKVPIGSTNVPKYRSRNLLALSSIQRYCSSINGGSKIEESLKIVKTPIETYHPKNLANSSTHSVSVESEHVESLFTAGRDDEIVKLWNERYGEYCDVVNFSFGQIVLRIYRRKGQIHERVKLAEFLFNRLMAMDTIEDADVISWCPSMAMAFLDVGLMRAVYEMLERLHKRNCPVENVAFLMLDKYSKKKLKGDDEAVLKLKGLAKKYPVLKKDDGNLARFLVTLMSKKSESAVGLLIQLLKEWEVFFGPRAVLSMIYAHHEGKIDRSQLQMYLDTLCDAPPESLTIELILEVAKLEQPDRLPNPMAYELWKRSQEFHHGEYDIHRYRLLYSLIIICCKKGLLDAAVEYYLDSFHCTGATETRLSTVNAFFIHPNDTAADFIARHIVSDMEYICADGTVVNVPLFIGETIHPSNFRILFERLLYHKKPIAALRILPHVMAHVHQYPPTPRNMVDINELLRRIMVDLKAQKTFNKSSFPTLMRGLEQSGYSNDIPGELLASFFSQVEALLCALASFSR
jgi:hypothetical protein